MKKIAIIGPINSRGGREIETAFIADLLHNKYAVSIYSTETIEKDNDLFLVNPTLDIYKKYKPYLNKIKSYLGITNTYNNIKFKNITNGKFKSLETAIKECTLIIIVAQLTSNYTKEIILLAKKFEKKIIFRTTGKIANININKHYYNYLESVNLFINHSELNSKIFKDNNLPYRIIDQCVFNETILLEEPLKNRDKIENFYCASRLDENKNVIKVVKAFNKLYKYEDLKLHIIGDGSELETLKSSAQNKNIIFHGHLCYKAMIKTISKLDCLIISSKEEAGPYSALEAAMLGIPIISTPVGAMPERFSDENNIWFNIDEEDALVNKILEYSKFNPQEVKLIQKRYIEIYKGNYSKKNITKAYLDVVNLYL